MSESEQEQNALVQLGPGEPLAELSVHAFIDNWADTEGFPDTSKYFERQIVRVKDYEVNLRRHVKLLDVRQAIM
ncbi:MAG: hypothetical protein P8M18_05895 [Woeseiaceae bacterium]|nr:hypothetical protein [Woeseiaceae bacterium]